jgi:hypothetical protein
VYVIFYYNQKRKTHEVCFITMPISQGLNTFFLEANSNIFNLQFGNFLNFVLMWGWFFI